MKIQTDNNSQLNLNKFKYFSKKNKNYEGPSHNSSNSGKTVEVFLFENNNPKKEIQKETVRDLKKEVRKELAKKAMRNRSPFNKSVDTFSKKYKTKYGNQFSSFSYKSQTPMATSKRAISKSKICSSEYQKYINQIRKVATSSKLKELHKKMHSSISSGQKKDKSCKNSSIKTESKPIHKIKTGKVCSSFIFQSKSPLSTSHNTCSQNFVLKNKKSFKIINNSDESKKNNSKNKKFKRNFSKKSI